MNDKRIREFCNDIAKQSIDEYECESIRELSDYFYMHPSEIKNFISLRAKEMKNE